MSLTVSLSQLPSCLVALAETDSIRDKAKALYLEGQRPCHISKTLGISSQLVSVWANRFGWVAVKREVNKRVSKLIESNVVSSFSKQGMKHRLALANELERQVACLAAEPCASYSELVTTKEGQGRAAVVKTVLEASSVCFGWKDQTGIGQSPTQFTDWADSIEVEEVKPSVPQVTDSQPDNK